jgi:DNA polymerase-3 subunit delta
VSLDILKKQLKEGNFSQLYLIYGNEPYLKDFYTKDLVSKIVPKGMEDFNIHRIDGQKLDVNQLQDAVEGLPIFAERKCVIIKDLDAEAVKQQDFQKLEKILEDIPQDSVVIIHISSIEPDFKKKAKWKGLLAITQKIGLPVLIDHLPKADLMKWIKKNFTKLGCEIPDEAVRHLIDMVGSDMLSLNSEIEKIAALAEGKAENKHIDMLVAKTLDSTVFKLAGALVKRDYDTSFKMLYELFAQKEEPVAIAAVLSKAFIDLYRVRVALDYGADPLTLAKNFDYKNKEFLIKNAVRDCKNISAKHLRKCLNLFIETDVALKSSKTDNKIILEELFGKILSTN